MPQQCPSGGSVEILTVASVVLSAVGVGLGLASFILAHGRRRR